ncbi:MAG TPA: maleylpyruvate isomerase family mycothiol-dependent enzyme [Vicinamibacteria bacterium]|nr:maleylpyruvate isomerase family mycothiol-dependent enzyme [Vicinamibacteria bacterium]
MLEPIGMISTAHLFPGLHRHLMELLRGLAPKDWNRPTLAPAWTVREVAAHLLDGQVRRLSFQRDGLPMMPPEGPMEGYRDVVRFLNDLNADWIRATRRLSANVLMDFLEMTGPQVCELFAALDPLAPAFFPVAWADESKSENWFDVGREYTEWWHHQAQIRDAVGVPALTDREWLHPVLELSMKAFPRAFKGVLAAPDMALVLRITGEAGGTWSAIATRGGWSVLRGEKSDAAARARCDEDTAWRLFFNALSEEEARDRIDAEGDERLIRRLLSARGVMV